MNITVIDATGKEIPLKAADTDRLVLKLDNGSKWYVSLAGRSLLVEADQEFHGQWNGRKAITLIDGGEKDHNGERG